MDEYQRIKSVNFLSEIEKVNIMIIYQNEIISCDARIAEKLSLKMQTL